MAAGREETRTATSDFKKEVSSMKCSKHHGKGGKINLGKKAAHQFQCDHKKQQKKTKWRGLV